jgi:gamma-glutamyltranspeptidase/glutathione hydrolase
MWAHRRSAACRKDSCVPSRLAVDFRSTAVVPKSYAFRMSTPALFVAPLLLLIASPLAFADRPTGLPFATRSEVIAANGMAATSHPLATQIAVDIQKAGGSAVDAALGLMEPTGSGIGGDLFAIGWDAKTDEIYGLNASGRSPRGLTLDEFRRQGLTTVPDFGPLPVTVPGCVDGWFELHARYGRLPMEKLLEPTIRYAREGFPVSPVIAHHWAAGKKLCQYPGFEATFFPNGRAPAAGEMHRNAALADTLEAIARGGRDAFYRGALTRVMDAFCRENGCFLRYEDFDAHRSEWVTPLSTNYRGYDIWELPPNTQGLAVLQMLNILEGYDLAKLGHNSAKTLHYMLEAKKLAFEDRARYYADPDFARRDYAYLASKAYAAERRALIDDAKAGTMYPAGAIPAGLAGSAPLKTGDTVYLCTADRDGNMVSLIQSNYRGFGSGMCPPLGFCFQDRGALFSLDPSHANAYAPGKRPFHTIIPGFATRDGKPWLAFGVMGGDMQPQGHVQVLCNLIDFGMNVQEAGDAARWYHDGSTPPTASESATAMRDGGSVMVESGVPGETRAALEAMGHRFIRPQPAIFGGYQAILRDPVNGVYRGASESRKDGCAMGY